MRKHTWSLAVLAALTLMAQGAVAAPAKGAKASPAFNRALLNPAALKAKAPETYQAKFITSKGEFTVKVTRAWAPKGADRFYNLVKNRFFDNASFFRVIPGFMTQFGMSAYPPVSAAWANTDLQDDPVTQSNTRGRISFATKGPNSRTTQVFINTADNARLDGMGFSPFGEVDALGLAVVEALYSGYGEGAPQGMGPSQGLIESQGKTYLDKSFPKLDRIKSAVIVGGAATAKKTGKKAR